MTIDERIMSERGKAENWKSFHKKCDFNTECNECGTGCEAEEKDHEQLAEWLEELKELKEKNTEKKVEVWANGEEHCPCCDKKLSSLGFFKHCIDCGQKLDWSDEK